MEPPEPTPPDPRQLISIADLTNGNDHPTARLVELIPGRSNTVYKNWLHECREYFHYTIHNPTLNTLEGYRNTVVWSTPRHH